MGVVKSKKMQGACNVVWKKRLKKRHKKQRKPIKGKRAYAHWTPECSKKMITPTKGIKT